MAVHRFLEFLARLRTMNDFNSLFPSFLNDCVQLKTALMPIGYLSLTAGMISTTIADHRSVSAMMRTFGRTIVYAANSLLQFLTSITKTPAGVMARESIWADMIGSPRLWM